MGSDEPNSMGSDEGYKRIRQALAMADDGMPLGAFSVLQEVVLGCAHPIRGLAALKAAEIYMQEIVKYRTDRRMLNAIEVMLKVAMQSSDDQVVDIARTHLEVVKRKFADVFEDS